MEDIYITIPINYDLSKNLCKELEKYPLITKKNGYRGVFFHKKTDKDITYVVRYGQVRDRTSREDNNFRGPMPESVKKKISNTRRGIKNV